MKIGNIEFFLIQVIIYTIIYLIDPYIGFLVCLILGIISTALLVLSLIFELVDRSKVPRSYYFFMLNSIIAAFLVLGVFSLFVHGSFDWMKQ